MRYLSLDIGTTCCKYQIFAQNGDILDYQSREYDLKTIEGQSYVDIFTVWQSVKDMLKGAAAKYSFDSICISTMGESFVMLDKEDNILFLPMLYTDIRGSEQACRLTEHFGIQRLFDTTGVLPQGMYSVSKLLWIKENHPSLFAKADKVMLIGDYLGYLLTGERVIDYGLAARTGAFDVHNLKFDNEILEYCGISQSLFSTPKRAGSIVGKIRDSIREELNIGDCTLVLGSHDQICATLGAGVVKAGQAADGMGTVECITALFDQKPTDVNMGLQGYPCVPFPAEGLYCTYILNYSCGSLTKWYKDKIMHRYKGEENTFFEYIEKGFEDGPTGILTLPYIGGAATPFQNAAAKGAILNLSLSTTDSQVYKSLLEGTAMEMRLNAGVIKEYGIDIKSAVATGGGANSEKWLQLKADIQNIPFRTLRSSEGGLCGCAILQAVAMGQEKSLEDAAKIFVKYGRDYTPCQQAHLAYSEQYAKYEKLYNTIKELY